MVSHLSGYATSLKVAVVIDANEGIGLSIVKLILAHHPDWIVYLTSRDPVLGVEAVQHLSDECQVKARFHQLDIEDAESIRVFKSYLVKTHPRGIDIFVSNVGIFPSAGTVKTGQVDCYGSPAPDIYDFNEANTRRTMEANYFATMTLCTQLFPLLSLEASVVMVSSRMAHLAYMNSSPEMQSRMQNCSTVEEITKLMASFMNTDPANYQSEGGWLSQHPVTEIMPGYRLGDIYAYGIAKLGVALLAMAYQNEFRSKNYRISVNACCPGPIPSESFTPSIVLPPDQGADTPFYLSDLDRDSQHHGDFVAERKSIGHFVLSDGDFQFLLNMSA